jgi:hypothetical protein
MSELISLQGSIYAATRNTTTGKPGKRTWLGNASSASLKLSVDKSDKTESFSGARGLYGSLVKTKSATLEMTLDEFLPENLALGLHGAVVGVTAGTVASEAFPTGLLVGDEVQLANRFVSSVVLKDSTGSPVTVDAADYEVNATAGYIKLLDVSGYTQPFTAAYSYAAADNLALFSNVAPPERWITFDGINTVTGKKIVLDLFRVQFDPVADFGLINDDWGGLQLSGTCLLDAINLNNSNMGGYGRLTLAKA